MQTDHKKTFLVVEIVPVSIDTIGYKTYIYFAVFNACFIPLTYFFYPETRNLSLEQIDLLFTGEKVLLYWDPSMGERRGSLAVEAVEKAASQESTHHENIKVRSIK